MNNSDDYQNDTNDNESSDDADTRDQQKSNSEKYERFPIVGIGASAGGLEALQELFRSMPVDTGMGFVVVTHQHPGHESILAELLSRETAMRVYKIEDGIHVEPNNVYVLGASSNLRIEHGTLHLKKIDVTTALHMPIDIFFRSLAEDMHERAICIVLSGTGSDGTLGMKEIKAQGGLALAQEPPSAKYGGMPSSARDTGMVDFVEIPSRMPKRMTDYIWSPFHQLRKQVPEEDTLAKEDINGILRFLRSRLGHDFSSYKSSTIRRRIQRRMSIHGIKDAHDYLEYLHGNRPEVQMLFSELLISVTSFFRDPEAFGMLQAKFLPDLIQSRPEGHEFRVWVAGCATGEEAYSIAIILDEIKLSMRKTFDIRIFGTDLDDAAVQRARHGVYPSSISIDVNRERLARYFTPEGEDAFAIRKELRDMLVFAPQNLLSDPPFMKVDLLVCRNVLIYLQSDVQKLILPTFHYSINPDGLLFLGASESVGAHTDLFESLDNRWKIYRRRDVPTELPHIPARTGKTETPIPEKSVTQGMLQPQTNRLIERFLLSRFAPVSIVIDNKGIIAYIHGRTGYYLEPEQQQPRNNVFEMAREGLRIPLTSAVHQALEKGEEVVRNNIPVRTNGSYTNVTLSVTPVSAPEQLRGLLLITIVPSKETPEVVSRKPEIESGEKKATPERIVELERELVYIKENNQTMVEELQSTNEELQSANEELQSTNEELQSSKEEMESLNEELSTVNNELNSKVEALSQARDDMQNLLNSTDLGVIFLDEALRVKRYTAKARSVINLRDTDVGRPISDLTIQLKNDNLLQDCKEVLDSLIRKEKEVATSDDNWLLMRILPYRTSENVIGGVVVTFVDITQTKQMQIQATEEQFLSAIVEQVQVGIWITDASGHIITTNAKAGEIWAGPMPETKSIQDYTMYRSWWADNGKEVKPEEQPLVQVLLTKRPISGVHMNIQRLDGSMGVILVSAAPILDKSGTILGAVSTAQDITDYKHTVEMLHQSEERFRALVSAISFVVYRMSPDWQVMRELRGANFLADTGEPDPDWTDKYILPEDLQLVRNTANEAIRTQTMFQLEHRVRRVDGTVGWTLSRAIPLINNKGEIYEWFGAAADITESKLAAERITHDLNVMTELQKLSLVTLENKDPWTILKSILDSTIRITAADFADIRLVDPATGIMKIVVSQGVEPWWIDFWNSESTGTGICADMQKCKERIVIEDIEKSEIFSGTEVLGVQLRAGMHASQFTPLVKQNGGRIGLFSTHYKKPHVLDDLELRYLDLLARYAVEIIVRLNRTSESNG